MAVPSMPFVLSKRLSPIGIDLGTRCIKAAQLELREQRPRVVALAQHTLPHTFESAQDRLEAIRSGIQLVIRTGQFSGKEVVLGLNSNQLFVQNVRVPRLPDEELNKVVRWEIDERLPEDFGEAEVRHLIAGDIRAPSGSGEGTEIKREVIVLACRRKEIQELISLLESVHLRPRAIDVSACALVRTSHTMLRRRVDEQSAFLFIDMGAGGTTAVVARGADILLIKTLPVGGLSMDRIVARKLKLSAEDAALARRQRASSDAAHDPDLARVVGEAVRGEIESLAAELLMCVRYHSVTFRGNRISRALLFGGEGDAQLAAQFSSRIDIPCELADPFQGSDISPEVEQQIKTSPRGQWVVALGLCARTNLALAG
jgi:type IV pilus assembly protein PilM